MATKLYVGGLPYATKEDELEELFAAYGKVVSAAIVKDKFTEKSRGFGFVEMDNAEEAQAAIDGLNGKDLDGKTLTVNLAREKTDGDRRGGYRPNNGGGPRRNGGNAFRTR
ncbi:MAG: RNA-binding protein [Candidatus Nomurabacteria bacterium]|nr:RNA-binding protein [Candidatus Nomurabacteria bacterium]